MSLNKVMLLGRLGADPEVRFLPNGNQVTTIRLATSRRWKDKNTNERKEETEWHRVVLYSGLAKIAGDYMKKGSQCHIEGRIKTTKWTGQDGTDKYTTEIIADGLSLLSSSGENNSSAQNSEASCYNAPSQTAPQSGGGSGGAFDDFDDDLPF